MDPRGAGGGIAASGGDERGGRARVRGRRAPDPLAGPQPPAQDDRAADAVQRTRAVLSRRAGNAPVYVAEEIADNRFKISGGRAGLKVSWQVTGIRHDNWANANRIPVEEDKADHPRGYHLHPEAFGMPRTRGIDYARRAKPDGGPDPALLASTSVTK